MLGEHEVDGKRKPPNKKGAGGGGGGSKKGKGKGKGSKGKKSSSASSAAAKQSVVERAAEGGGDGTEARVDFSYLCFEYHR